MDLTSGHDRSEEPFRDLFVLYLKEVIQAFATTTPGFDHDKRSRWAYAFNPLPDGIRKSRYMPRWRRSSTKFCGFTGRCDRRRPGRG